MAGDRNPDKPRRPQYNVYGDEDRKQPPGRSARNPNRPSDQPYQPFPDREYARPLHKGGQPSHAPQGKGVPTYRPPSTPPRPPRDFFSPQSPQRPPGPPRPAPRKPARTGVKIGRIFLYGGLVLVALLVLAGLFLFTRANSLFEGISVPRVDVNGQQISGTNVNGNGKVNILLMGVDSRKNDQGDGTRTDTMILVSVDQSAKTASLLSIPRDLWVAIPGFGNNRVNAAFFFGDQEKPGTGGPPLAKLTVERNFGVPVHYFAMVDFEGFQDIINALGGVNIDVKKPLIDAEYPTEDFGVKRIFIPAGLQHMNGQIALEYARSRHSDSDLGRNQRQQEVLMAVRERGANLGLVSNEQLRGALQKAIKTDLQWGDILSLAQTAIGMDRANIKSYAIDANMTRNSNIGGNDVLVPDWTTIGEMMKKFNNAK